MAIRVGVFPCRCFALLLMCATFLILSSCARPNSASAPGDGNSHTGENKTPTSAGKLSFHEIALQKDGGVRAVAFTTDGSTLAATADRNFIEEIDLWDVSGPMPKVRATISIGDTAPAEKIIMLAFSADGKKLAAGHGNQSMSVWEMSGSPPPKPAQFKHPGLGGLLSLAFSPNGKSVASGGRDQAILWHVSIDPVKQQALKGGFLTRFESLAFSPDGKYLASGCGPELYWWDVTGEAPKALPPLKLKQVKPPPVGPSVTAVTFSRDGSFLASGCLDNTIRIWDMKVAPPRETAVLDGHQGAIRRLVFSPDNQLLASTADDMKFIVWDLATQQPALSKTCDHIHRVAGIGTAPGKLLVAACDPQGLHLWSIKK